MSKGPAASPSSQIETRRMDAEVFSDPERSTMILSAMGTTPMHVNVLFEKLDLILRLFSFFGRDGGGDEKRNVTYTVKAIKASSKTIPLL